jgi:hypothetical protein
VRDRRPDEAVTRHALRRVRRLKKASGRLSDAERKALTEWETEFLDSVETRLDSYGSAFADPNLGDEEEALSVRQEGKLREVGRKVRRIRRQDTDIKETTTKPKAKAKPCAAAKPRAAGKPGAGLKRTPLKRKTPLRRVPKPSNGKSR